MPRVIDDHLHPLEHRYADPNYTSTRYRPGDVEVAITIAGVTKTYGDAVRVTRAPDHPNPAGTPARAMLAMNDEMVLAIEFWPRAEVAATILDPDTTDSNAVVDLAAARARRQQRRPGHRPEGGAS